MAAQSLLQREKFIRIAGILLLGSPLFNIYYSVSLALGPNELTLPLLQLLLKNLTVFFYATSVIALVTGFMMLKGRRSSWVSVLALLGVFIIFNIINFKRDLANGWFQPSIVMLTNVSLFILVYSQEFHQITQRKGLELLRMMRESKPNGPMVHFEGVGPWAKLIAITTSHVSMRAQLTPPPDIQSRILEIILQPDLILRARYIMHQPKAGGKDEYFFELIQMDATTQERLVDWLIVKKYARLKTPTPAAA